MDVKKYKNQIEKELYRKDKYLTPSEWALIFILTANEYFAKGKDIKGDNEGINKLILEKLHPSQIIYYNLKEKSEMKNYLYQAVTIISICNETRDMMIERKENNIF